MGRQDAGRAHLVCRDRSRAGGAVYHRGAARTTGPPSRSMPIPAAGALALMTGASCRRSRVLRALLPTSPVGSPGRWPLFVRNAVGAPIIAAHPAGSGLAASAPVPRAPGSDRALVAVVLVARAAIAPPPDPAGTNLFDSGSGLVLGGCARRDARRFGDQDRRRCDSQRS